MKIANRNFGKVSVILFGLLIACVFLPVSAGALVNPSAVYCSELGYHYSVATTTLGERGYCSLPDGQKVDAWKFLQGETAPDFTYCKKQGYDVKTVQNGEICSNIWSGKCAVCIMQNGTQVEVSRLMGLHFEETTCGDGACSDPENFTTCPKDCPSGSGDGFCDGVADGKCDPDCINGTGDMDCKTTGPQVTKTPLPMEITLYALAIGSSLLIKIKKR
jgi:hypothetical protein